MIVGSCWGRNRKKKKGGCGGGEDSGWGYGQGPSGYNEGIGRRDIGFDNAPDDDKNDRLGDNVDGWMGGEPASDLRSTKTLLVGGYVLRWTSGGRTKLRRWRKMYEWTEW